jgi:hypothetical protein
VRAGHAHHCQPSTLAARFPEVPLVIERLAHARVSDGIGGADFQELLALCRTIPSFSSR